MSSQGDIDRDALVSEFQEWLRSNGAKYPTIDWPSNNTISGIRGAVALEDISTNEAMIEIPSHLMMSPPIIFRDPVLGEKLKDSMDILHGDLLLTVYIVSEILKKEKSFYYPFLRILPEPNNIPEWTESELEQIQDPELVRRSVGRLEMVKRMYIRVMNGLCERYPDTFSRLEYTHKRFTFAWNTVQSRAFGRRLPWTALVPFADCLNHTNVQTKYDYDIGGNGVFRLFPSGTNSYARGSEVFNSYGRRPNDNLLLDYGFAMLENEWDEIDISLSLPDDENCYDEKRSALYQAGLNVHKRVHVPSGQIPLQALTFLRIVCLNEEKFAHLARRTVTILPAERSSATGTESWVECDQLNDGHAAGNNNSADKDDDDDVNAEVDVGIDGMLIRKKKTEKKTVTHQVPVRTRYDLPLSIPTELKCVGMLRNILQTLVDRRETSVGEDRALLGRLDRLREHALGRESADPQVAAVVEPAVDDEESAADGTGTSGAVAVPVVVDLPSYDSDAYWRLLSAVNYRLTRKLIVDSVLTAVETLQSVLSEMEQGARFASPELLLRRLPPPNPHREANCEQSRDSYARVLREYCAHLSRDPDNWPLSDFEV